MSHRAVCTDDLNWSRTSRVIARRYRLQRVLGRGSSAVVYLASDDLLQRTVAIKVCTLDDADRPPLSSLIGELEILSSLRHRTLPQFLDGGLDPAGPDGPCWYAVMEYIQGGTLASWMQSAAIGMGSVAAIGESVCEALAHIHGKGLVHRDVKPGNVLLEPAESPFHDIGVHARLIDFGLVRKVEQALEFATPPGLTAGTVRYLSPEQVDGGPVETASDIYSLGLVLLEALTGRQAYPGLMADSAAARLHNQPDIPDALERRWRGLLSAMCARSAADRPSATEAVGELVTLQ